MLGRAYRGFTLVELLVVLLIIGVMLSMVTLSIRADGVADRVELEAKRLGLLLEHASGEALIRGHAVGFAPDTGGYRFLCRKGAEKWEACAETGEFRPRALPEGMTLDLRDAPRRFMDGEPPILFSIDGLSSSGDLSLAVGDVAWRVRLYETGEVSIERERGDAPG